MLFEKLKEFAAQHPAPFLYGPVKVSYVIRLDQAGNLLSFSPVAAPTSASALISPSPHSPSGVDGESDGDGDGRVSGPAHSQAQATDASATLTKGLSQNQGRGRAKTTPSSKPGLAKGKGLLTTNPTVSVLLPNVRRTSGVWPMLLWDHSEYVFGIPAPTLPLDAPAPVPAIAGGRPLLSEAESASEGEKTQTSSGSSRESQQESLQQQPQPPLNPLDLVALKRAKARHLAFVALALECAEQTKSTQVQAVVNFLANTDKVIWNWLDPWLDPSTSSPALSPAPLSS